MAVLAVVIDISNRTRQAKSAETVETNKLLLL